MKNYLRVGALSFLASTVLFAACDKEEGGGIDIPNIKGNVNTIEIKERQPDPKVELDTEFTYFSLTQGKILDIKEAEAKKSKEWDLAFLTGTIRTNGGDSGSGECAVYLTETEDFNGVESAEEFIEQGYLWKKDEPTRTYIIRGSHAGGGPKSKILSVNPLLGLGGYYKMEAGEGGHKFTVSKNVYIVKLANGKEYVKIQFIDLAGKDKKFGNVQFRYKFIKERGKNSYKPIPAKENELIVNGEKEKPLASMIEGKDLSKITKLTIKGRPIKQDDLILIGKSMPMIKELDLSRASWAVGEDELGLKDNKNIIKVTLPENITVVGKGQFGYSALEEVVFTGNKLKRVAEGGFTLSQKLREVNLPNSVETFERSAFSGCSSLTTFTVPANLEIIPANCFKLCMKLEKVTLHKNVRRVGINAFEKCYALKEIILPEKIDVIPQECFFLCESLTKVEIKGAIKEIGEDAFFRTNKLESINFISKTAPEKIHSDAFNFLWKHQDDSGEFMMKNFKFIVPKGSKDAYVAKIPGFEIEKHASRIEEK